MCCVCIQVSEFVIYTAIRRKFPFVYSLKSVSSLKEARSKAICVDTPLSRACGEQPVRYLCSECLLFFAVSVLDGVVSPRSLVSGAESASATPCLPKIAIHAHSPAHVRGPYWYARVLPRRDGVGPTKERAQHAYIFH